jgi:hypothetical protein
MVDPANAKLAGDVSPGRAGGAIRYRTWPARRRPVLALLTTTLVFALTFAAWYGFESVFYTAIVFVGAAIGAALAFFPTEVSLDGHQLNLRQLGTPRTWDLRRFRRLEVCGEPLPRVELRKRARMTPIDPVEGTVVPLPADAHEAEIVVHHLRHWVGRQVTGRFDLDDDHTPEDSVIV